MVPRSNDLEWPRVTYWNIQWHEASRGLSMSDDILVSNTFGPLPCAKFHVGIYIYNWTHGAASRHTTAPISHTDHCSLYHYIIFWNLLPVMKHPIVVVSAIEWKWFANSIRLRLRQAQHLKTCCSRRADNGHGVEAISRNPGRNIDKPQPHSPPPCRQTSRRRRPTVGRVDTYRPNG